LADDRVVTDFIFNLVFDKNSKTQGRGHMKQVLQSLKDGATTLADVPCPQLKSGHVLIRTQQSLISPGTEKMLVDFGNASLINKAKQQPDKIRQVLDKIKTDGLFSTLDAVRSKLDQSIPMGYCNVGEVIGVGIGANEFFIGDRVVSNGAHAEIVSVPKNLCCKIPNDVTNEDAAFTVIGAIALQGIRLAAPTLGETFSVIGLGLIGLLTVQLLKAHGCRVFGMDLDPAKVELAKQFGAEALDVSSGADPIAAAFSYSRFRGVDGVIITASTKNNEPIHQAAQMCRQRGRIILVGVTGLELSRADFYKKELSFQVSCSYGPGRYDTQYEELGQDYPLGFVRWTEQRNFEAFLDILSHEAINLQPLLTHRFDFSEAELAYALLQDPSLRLGILLNYPQTLADQSQTIRLQAPAVSTSSSASIAVIGAGNYASRVLIPAFKAAGAELKTIAASTGISAAQLGKKFGFEAVSTLTADIFSKPDINTVVIASRHDSHADYVIKALQSGKNVFVEKPLCLTFNELQNIEQQFATTPCLLMVGFNRRFSPHVKKIKSLLHTVDAPKSFIMTVNAGDIPASHWTQDQTSGGGRLIGEACHFIDLLRYLAAAPIVSYYAAHLDNTPVRDDKIAITLTFGDGSLGVINYFANGHRSFPKERLEIFTAGKILQCDNFRKLRGYGWPQFKKMNLFSQDKGQENCAREFMHAVKYGLPAPIPAAEIFEVARVTLQIANAIKKETIVDHALT
jgi:predicted dehydrogenase/threonine dehydrogenase-like Zn-dependent dehydrogenase